MQKQTKFTLARRYFQVTNQLTDIRPITIEFKSDYAVLEEESRGIILLNKTGQRKLYNILKKRFEK